jgi:tryptophan halogenase
MTKKVDSITIVGGGSAGWMSAATMIKFFPNKEINVIESPDYPIIGVGESTLGHINRWLHLLGISDREFMVAADASYKHSIAFTDFYQKGSGRFQYPFGDPFMDGLEYGFNNWYIMKYFYPWIPSSDFAYAHNPSTTFAEMSVMVDENDGTFDNFNPSDDVAYHIDSVKFGQWLKYSYCLPKGVKLLPNTVEKVNTNSDGIETLILDDGTEHSADLYIDCTGFKALLLGDALDNEFISYEDILPNNKAWAVRIPYTDQEKEQVGYTNCTALGNGWVWNTPCHSRIGSGYVYSDKYVTDEEALKEFQDHIGRDDLEFRNISFKTGVYSKIWNKNVVGIGLAAGFIEPLESNGLYTIHEFLLALVKNMSKGYVNAWDRDCFNLTTRNMYDTFATFVSSHYKMSCRDDTEYWRDVTESSVLRDENTFTPYVQGDFKTLHIGKMVKEGFDPGTGQPYIATGLNYFPIDDVTISSWSYHYKQPMEVYTKLANDTYEFLMARKEKWETAARKYPSIKEYIDKHFYQ